MKVTRIAKVGKDDKFAVFLDGTLKLFLSGQSLLNNGLQIGDELTDMQVTDLSNLSKVDEFYLKALKYVSLRLKSEGEINLYLKRKGATNEQQREVVKKLKQLDLINDERFARAFIHDKLMVTPASKRKIAFELKKKRVAQDIIDLSLSREQVSDEEGLKELIAIKRRQSKYQDDLKLMQYLVRNGFNYGDVKQALKDETN